MDWEKPIELTRHALEKMAERDVAEGEVIGTIRTGEEAPAKRYRRAYRKNFPYNRPRDGQLYPTKQVLAVVVEELDRLVVVTVYAYFF